jgi:hypothetical protein
MNNFDRTAQLWLEYGPTELSDRALQAALDEIHVTRQRRAWWPAPRFSAMGNTIRLAAAVATVVLAGVVGVTLLPGGGAPEPSPAPSPTPTPSPRALTDGSLITLEPGTYVAADPFPLRVTFTVPAGWAGNIGGPYAVFLERATGLDAVSFSIFDTVYADPCHFDKGPLNPLPGPSVGDLATALVSLKGLDATTATDVTLSGYQGKQLTLTAPASFAGCTLTPDGNFRVWELPLGATNDLTPGERDRVWILDVGGTRLVIDAPETPGQTPAERAEVQGIVDSIQIAQPQ